MKSQVQKIAFLVLSIFMMTNYADAQGAAEKGNVILQPDFNLGATSPGWHGWYGGRGFVPGFTFNAEYFVHDYASVGAYVGYGARHKFHNIAAGVRGNFHWWQLLDDKVDKDLKSDKLDIYLPVHLGAFIYAGGGGSSTYFNAGSGLGVRYYFHEKIGVNAEFGLMEMSFAKIGITVKL